MAVQPRGASLRGLKALVGILGVLVVLGTALVIGVVIHRLYGKPAEAAPGIIPGPAAPVPAAGGLAPHILAHGEHISGIAGAAGQVAIWVTGPGGAQIMLLDPVTGRLTVVISAGP